MSQTPIETARKPYARRVYGRRRVKTGQSEWLIELHATGLLLHQKYARKSKIIPLSEIVDQLGLGQKLLPL